MSFVETNSEFYFLDASAQTLGAASSVGLDLWKTILPLLVTYISNPW